MALVDEIRELLATSRGEPFLKRLFWELLEFDRVNEPLPYSALPQERRADIADCRILARCGPLYVCLLRLSASELRNGLEEPILDCLHRAWPSVLAIFSSFGGAELDFCWRAGRAGASPTHRLLIDDASRSAPELARLLCALTTCSVGLGQERSPFEVLGAIDRILGRMPRSRRERHRDGPLGCFLKSLARWDPLSAEEEEELGLRWRVDEDSDARQALILHNLRLVVHIARGDQGRGLDLEDLIQAGCVGLIMAVDRFDPTVGTRFSTYASYWIRQHVHRAVLTEPLLIAVPAYMFELLSEWLRRQECAGTETTARIGADDGTKVLRSARRATWRIRDARTALRASYWRRDGTQDTARLKTSHADDLPGKNLEREDLTRAVEVALRSFDERDAFILRHRLGLNGDGKAETLLEIGQRVGLTRERVRQLERGALSRFRELLKEFGTEA